MSPQKEQGFTPIANELFEAFYQCKLLEYERCIVMCIWRKTYGWSKKTDWIANSQFVEETGIEKGNVNRTIKALIEKKIITKEGKKIAVNKSYLEWKVAWRKVVSPDYEVVSPDYKKLSHQTHTKESKETITKETSDKGSQANKSSMANENLIPEVIKLFESVDPKNKTYYGNKSQRAACQFLLDEYGLIEIEKRTVVLPKTNTMPFFPTVTTPCQLRDKWVQLGNAILRAKSEQEVKSNNVIW